MGLRTGELIKMLNTPFRSLVLVTVAAVYLCSMPALAQDEGEEVQQQSSQYGPVDSLPPAVVEAAQQAKNGIILQKAKLTWRTDEGVYIVVGQRYGTRWRMNITRSGQVLSLVELDKS